MEREKRKNKDWNDFAEAVLEKTRKYHPRYKGEDKKIILNFILAFFLGLSMLLIIERVSSADPNPTATSRGLEEEWWTTCADNTAIVWDNSRIVSLPNLATNKTDYLFGGFAPTNHTYELFPRCVNMLDMSNYVDMTCLLKSCTKLIQYNVLNGSIREIWKKGEPW